MNINNKKRSAIYDFKDITQSNFYDNTLNFINEREKLIEEQKEVLYKALSINQKK